MKLDDVRTPHMFINLEEQMQAMGAQVRVIEGDGNCFFRAMSDQLTGNCDSHGMYRRDTAQYMLTNRHIFADFIVTDDYDEYVRNLGQDAIYVDNESLLAFANLTLVTIVVHQLNQGPILITATSIADNVHPEVHITYEAQHYNSVRWNSEEPQANTPAQIAQRQLRHNLDRFLELDHKHRAAMALVSDTSDDDDDEEEEGTSSEGSGKSGAIVRGADSSIHRTVKNMAESKGVRLEQAMRALEISDYDRKKAEQILDQEKGSS